MRSVNIHEAKTHLSRLVELAAKGEPFIIAKAGRPLVKVVPLEATDVSAGKRIGFMDGEIRVPEDFDQTDAEEIQRLFEGDK
jgi:prevent-host-death family protein